MPGTGGWIGGGWTGGEQGHETTLYDIINSIVVAMYHIHFSKPT